MDSANAAEAKHAISNEHEKEQQASEGKLDADDATYYRKRCGELEKELAEWKKNHQGIYEKNVGLQKELDESEAELKARNEEIATLEPRMKNIENDLQRTTEENTRLHRDNELLREDKSNVEFDLGEKKQTVHFLEAQEKILTRRCTNTQAELERSKDDCADLAVAVEELKLMVEQRDEHIEGLRTDLSIVMQERDHLVGSVKVFHDFFNLSNVNMDPSSLRDVLHDWQQENASAPVILQRPAARRVTSMADELKDLEFESEEEEDGEEGHDAGEHDAGGHDQSSGSTSGEPHTLTGSSASPPAQVQHPSASGTISTISGTSSIGSKTTSSTTADGPTASGTVSAEPGITSCATAGGLNPSASEPTGTDAKSLISEPSSAEVAPTIKPPTPNVSVALAPAPAPLPPLASVPANAPAPAPAPDTVAIVPARNSNSPARCLDSQISPSTCLCCALLAWVMALIFYYYFSERSLWLAANDLTRMELFEITNNRLVPSPNSLVFRFENWIGFERAKAG
ncbi:hypothetical protein MBLNU459_g2244t1 [Dothideomycetes sp. NU459]